MAEFKLCENTDCERYPPDWDFEEDTEDTWTWEQCSFPGPAFFILNKEEEEQDK